MRYSRHRRHSYRRRGSGLPRISPFLYKWSRKINTLEAWLSLDPSRIFRRYLNRMIGRQLLGRNRLGRLFRLW